jgi:hypothetical protein
VSRSYDLARQQLALRFQVAPADYAHHSWWHDSFASAFGTTVRPLAGARVQLSAWMLEQYGLLGSVDLEFEPHEKRFWLLPADSIRRTALDLGVALHRDLLRRCISRASWRAVSSRFERETIDFALSDPATRLMSRPGLEGCGVESIPSATDCADIGAAELLRAAERHGAALFNRAKLIFPRSSRSNAAAEPLAESGSALMAGAVARSLQIAPSWRWLYS